MRLLRKRMAELDAAGEAYDLRVVLVNGIDLRGTVTEHDEQAIRLVLDGVEFRQPEEVYLPWQKIAFAKPILFEPNQSNYRSGGNSHDVKQEKTDTEEKTNSEEKVIQDPAGSTESPDRGTDPDGGSRQGVVD